VKVASSWHGYFRVITTIIIISIMLGYRYRFRYGLLAELGQKWAKVL